MQQLSAQDASFLYGETSATPMHVGSVSIYDGAHADPKRLTEEAILKAISERLHLAITTRRKCIRVPMEADYPYWLEDQDFDLEYHVRRIGLPQPADWAELKKLTARVFSHPLDLTKPLWEFYIIEGLNNLEGISPNSFALLTKTHHAAIDGASGVHFFELMHDLQPAATKFPPPQSPWRPEPEPNPAELLFRTGMNNLAQPFRLAEFWARQVARNTRNAQSAGNVTGDNMRPRNIPKTRFNGRVTPHRVMGSLDFDLDQIRDIRKMVAGATVNDAVLAICGGALRQYLLSKNELDPEPMVAMAPVNVRDKSSPTSEAGNKVSALFVPIGTQIEDPRERLLEINQQTSASKIMHDAVGAADMTDYGQFVPAYTAAMASRLMTETAANAPTPPFNVSITNVPGPQVPLYFCGAPMLTNVGLGPITQGMGLIFPVLSYNGRMTISFTSCREMIPDADFFEACIQNAFDEMVEARKSDSAKEQQS